MTGTPTSTDDLRLLAVEMLRNAKTLIGRDEPADEALQRAYRASLNDFETPEQILGLDRSVHPATDLWTTAHRVALGALALANGGASSLGDEARISFAVELLLAEIKEPKAVAARDGEV